MAAADSTDHQLQLATAVLLVEVMRTVSALADSECSAVVAALQREFSLPADDVARLIDLGPRAFARCHGLSRFHVGVERALQRLAEAAHRRSDVAGGLRRRPA